MTIYSPTAFSVRHYLQSDAAPIRGRPGRPSSIAPVGSAVKFFLENRVELLGFINFSYTFLCVGGILFVVTFVGFLGALRENRCFLLIYDSMLFILIMGKGRRDSELTVLRRNQ